MAKSKYEFKKLKSKSAPARIVDSTAVRVLAKAGTKLSQGWKKFIANAKDSISNMRTGTSALNTIATKSEAMVNKMEENAGLVAEIKQDEAATAADFKVMAKAQHENEKLEAKLNKLLNKKTKIETKKGTSNDLVEALDEELENNQETITSDDLTQAFDAAGVTPNQQEVVQTNQTPVIPEIKPVEITTPVMAPSSVAPTNEQQPAATPVNNGEPSKDPVVSRVIAQLNKINEITAENANLKTENARLAAESKTKDETINGLQSTVTSLTTENQKLTTDYQTLQQTNANQAVNIATLKKDNDSLSAQVTDYHALEQQLANYKNTVASHEREMADMQKELERVRFDANKVQGLQSDIARLSKENDYYKQQLMAIQKAVGITDDVVASSDMGRTR